MEENIEKAIKLSLIGRSKEEKEKLMGEIPKLLSYVDKVTTLSSKKVYNPQEINVVREDKVSEEEGKYKEVMLKEANSTSKGYIKVKKVL